MGASHSQQYKEGAEGTKMKPVPLEEATPPREQNLPRRRLPFDPRSPSTDITRTPIIVEKAPDALLSLDPRSPTVGVERTPLTVLMNKDFSANHNLEMSMDTSSHSLSTEDAAPLSVPEETGDAEMVTLRKSEAVAEDCLDDIPDIDADDASPLLKRSMPLPAAEEPTPMATKLSQQPKQLFADIPMFSDSPCSSPVTKASMTPRSPLGLVVVDTNSPRSLVQSKQRRHVSKALGQSRGRRMPVDKENVVH